MDKLPPLKRSENMRAIRSTNTKPEMIVRKLVYQLGFRYRLHSKLLPGKPDLVFPGKKKVIFVHGCFWHQHNCRFTRPPKSNIGYWLPKLEKTKDRDRFQTELLIKLGWSVLTVWECEIKDVDELTREIKNFLNQ